MNITFGQYYPTDSIIHKMDVRIKILISLLYIVIVFFCKSYISYAVLAFVILLNILLSKVPVGTVFKTVKVIIFILLFTAILNIFFYKDGTVLAQWWKFRITDMGLINASKMCVRLVLLMLGTTMLTLTATAMDLTDGMESLMTPLKWIRFPVHDVALIMSIALRFIPTLSDETDKIIKAQKSRGANFSEGGLIKRAKALLPILIPLLVGAFRRADELALALDARCYNATANRTKMKKITVHAFDIIALLFVLGASTVIILMRYNVIPIPVQYMI